jgi:acylphosphatase
MNSDKKRYHVVVSGRVQGVWFRANTKRQAEALGLSGWVKNLPDGRVEAVFEGQSDDVERMLAWCRTGTPPARVDFIDCAPEPPDGDSGAFRIIYA